jgi:hypothetical protein
VCGERIKGGESAMACWNPKRPEDGVLHIHKGKCDRRTDPKRIFFWVDMDVHAVFLRRNLNLKGADWKDAERRADFMEAI